MSSARSRGGQGREVLAPGEATASNSNAGMEMTLGTEQSHGIPATVVKLAFLRAATEAGTCPTVLSTIPSGLQISSAEKSTHSHHLPPKILRLLIHCRASSRIFHCGAHGDSWSLPSFDAARINYTSSNMSQKSLTAGCSALFFQFLTLATLPQAPQSCT